MLQMVVAKMKTDPEVCVLYLFLNRSTVNTWKKLSVPVKGSPTRQMKAF